MIVEVRIFTCNPGKLSELMKRFKTTTLAIWKKHGIRQIGFWTVLIGDGSNDLHCALSWKSMAERERKWAKFRADPAWRKVRAETEKDGPILANINSVFLRPADFSALKCAMWRRLSQRMGAIYRFCHRGGRFCLSAGLH